MVKSVFKTSLNVEAFKEILQRRAFSREIKITIKRNKLILRKCKMRIGGFDFQVPFIAKISTENNKTVVKGNISLPKSYYIVSLITILAPTIRYTFITIINGIQIYKLFLMIIIAALLWLGLTSVFLNLAKNNFPPNNNEVLELLDSIVNDFPDENFDQSHTVC